MPTKGAEACRGVNQNKQDSERETDQSLGGIGNGISFNPVSRFVGLHAQIENHLQSR